MTASRLVYTAITGTHAQLSARPDVPDTDFVCFSDIPLDRDDWKIRPIEAPAQLSPRMQAKFHKLFPPEDYEWTVWVDGAYSLRADASSHCLMDDLIAHSPSGFGLHRHHWYDCLYAEAAHTLELPKCADQHRIIEDQVRHYAEAGHPKDWGLWAGGLMCRNQSPLVAEIMHRWWEEILRWSWRDQLSLPVALRSLHAHPDTWPWPLFQNPHFPAWTWNPI